MSAQLAKAYPVSVVCAVLETPRSTLYVRRHNAPTTVVAPAEAALRAHIERISGAWPTCGSRRVTAQVRREGAGAVNGKPVRRLMGALGLAGHAPVRRCRTTNSDHPSPRYPNRVAGLAITYPDMVWVADSTSVRLQQDFVYLAVLMDVYTRAIRGWELSGSLEQTLTLTALNRAVVVGHQPGIHHSDQGAQYAALAYTARLEQLGTPISMAEQGRAGRATPERLC
jgi:transposase InsO family protein